MSATAGLIQAKAEVIRPLDQLSRRPAREFPASHDDAIVSCRLERVFQRFSRRVALLHEEQTTTYGELSQRAKALAAQIAGRVPSASEMEHSPPVGLLTLDPVSRIVGMVAALKLGRSFLPLDPAAPVGRLQMMLRDAGCTSLVTDVRNDFASVSTTFPGETIAEEQGHESIPLPPVAASPDTGVLMLYTSGSTGQPKRITQTHAMVMHTMAEYARSFRIAPEDRLSLLASPGFAEYWNVVFMALLNGASLAIREAKTHGMVGLADWLQDCQVTVLHCVPTLLRGIVVGLDRGVHMPSLRLLNMGGESVSRSDLEACWDRLNPDCIVVNSFGTTETKLVSQFFADRETLLDSAVVPVGRPISGTTVRILNENGFPVSDGEIGEIEVCSRCIARHYEQSAPEDQQRFVATGGDGESIGFRTGDVGRFNTNGLLEHLGRHDRIVKLRGYRVGLAEVESALHTHPEVSQAIILVHGESSQQRYLVAAFTAVGQPSSAKLREHLSRLLPDYMIPSRFLQVDELPVNSSGKIDSARAAELIHAAAPLNGPSGAEPRVNGDRVSATLSQLIQLVREVLDETNVASGAGFLELGGDSLSATELMVLVEKSFGVRLRRNDVFAAPSLAQLAERIETAATGSTSQNWMQS